MKPKNQIKRPKSKKFQLNKPQKKNKEEAANKDKEAAEEAKSL